ncbi:uncharacterized protein HMPREF1541_00638 [Cyphellophora europaea CBS 101466]|uniref:Uncharacterized protein n=1 Tax=Cyphellophora europaea (strain CBS 101466) TaxID=1220924 RepID=W2SEZ4_CYPE1|nr:uncharacterized protein HMPREF1541_00638 [Cyphellophora europaea CBS 101466]ETN46454.1 hypothetical protein HMPREF1541_00638 [Cyphellophora europaea CBS 101466]
MPLRNMPPLGLTLSHADQHKKDGDTSPQIIRLDLLQSKTRDIIQQLEKGQKVVLQTGKQAAIHYGGEKLPLDATSEVFPAEIYTRSTNNDGGLQFSGRLSLHLEMQKAREVAARADAALANLQSTLTSMKEEQMNNGTTMVGTTKAGKSGVLKPMQSRRDLLSAGSSRPSSPFLGSAFSPAAGPTSNPLLGGGSNLKDKIRFEAMKVAVIHLLAVRPMNVQSIVEKIHAPRDECERALDKITRDAPSAPGKKELKDRSYRDLDVWKFRYPNQEDRQAAIERAIQAFDRMRIEKTDNLWQILLKPEDRGKGKTLSRLNFDKPAPAPKPASVNSKGNASDTEANRSPLKKPASQQKLGDKKSIREPAAKSRGPSPGPAKRKEVPIKGQSINDGKFKSAERIEDSDEELSTIEVATKRPLKRKEKDQPPLITKPRDRVQPPDQKQPLHKPSISSSSSASDNSDFSRSKPSLKPPSREDNPANSSKKSPRARHGSSPQKPSPLGSSPPANSNDFDSSSTTTKGTSQSSAPSSPPSGNEMPVPKQKQKYSPIVRDTARDHSQNRSSIKRKQEESDDIPPAKRPQLNGAHSKSINGTTKPLERPALSRKISESERSSSPEKPAHARDEVLDKAKRFQLYYKKYKNLHDKVARIPDKDRDDKDMDNLWEMHRRLKDMKTEIWNNWDRIEKVAPG